MTVRLGIMVSNFTSTSNTGFGIIQVNSFTDSIINITNYTNNAVNIALFGVK